MRRDRNDLPDRQQHRRFIPCIGDAVGGFQTRRQVFTRWASLEERVANLGRYVSNEALAELSRSTAAMAMPIAPSQDSANLPATSASCARSPNRVGSNYHPHDDELSQRLKPRRKPHVQRSVTTVGCASCWVRRRRGIKAPSTPVFARQLYRVYGQDTWKMTSRLTAS